MKVVTSYQSILGRFFATAREALADEDQLPDIIASNERSLGKLERGEPHGFNQGPHPQEDIDLYRATVAGYRAKWAEVQAQRAAGGGI